MKIAIVHDFFTQRGGAERLVSVWLSNFDSYTLHAAVHIPGATYEAIDAANPSTSPLQRLPMLREEPRRALPFLPKAISSLRIPSDADVVLVSSTAVAHHVRTEKPLVVYCHSPARWLWRVTDYEDQYPRSLRPFIGALRPFARASDKRAAQRATSYVANSTTIQKRIRDAYCIDAEIVHPPVTLVEGPLKPVQGVERGFVLAIGRVRGYKNIDTVASAVESLGLPLVVVGELPHRQVAWPSNFVELPRVSDAELRWLYLNAVCHATAAFEDFGLTVIEAHASGTPTVALAAGGFLDTVVPGVNGVLVPHLNVSEFAHAIRSASMSCWQESEITESVERFSVQRHMEKMEYVLEQAVSKSSWKVNPRLPGEWSR